VTPVRSISLGFLALTLGCAQGKSAEMPVPIAGLWHPAAARPGEVVVFDASSTAIGKPPSDDPGIGGARVTSYRFEIATFAAVERYVPNLSWTFADPGHYAVRLVVADDLGRESAVESAIDVVRDLADACTGTIAEACASGACTSGQCATFACAGAPACSTLNGRALTCDKGLCVVSAPATATEDAYGGGDVGAVGAADAGTP
jgi:hypothetical protein